MDSSGQTKSNHRTFFWSENCLWKKDIKGHRVTVSLAGKDLIVDTEAVGRYLAQDGEGGLAPAAWKQQKWKGMGLDILWFEELDHAQVFDSKANCEILANVVRAYSIREGGKTSYGSFENGNSEAD